MDTKTFTELYQRQHHSAGTLAFYQRGRHTMKEPPRSRRSILSSRSRRSHTHRKMESRPHQHITSINSSQEPGIRPPVPDLTLHLLPHRHAHLSSALFDSPHGGPIRILPMIISSGTVRYELDIPCHALYDRASNPTITMQDLTREQWNRLHMFVKEAGVLKVILSPDGGKTDFLGRLTTVEGARNERLEEGSMAVRVWLGKGRGGVPGAKMKRGVECARARMDGSE